jgi:hypothetical protein
LIYRVMKPGVMPGDADPAIALAVLGVMLLPRIFYLVTMHRAISKCDPSARSMPPGLVWLSMVPLLYMVWDFVVVVAVGRSLGNEYSRRNKPLSYSLPGLGIGISFCVLNLLLWIPFINLIAFPLGVVLWLIFWAKIARLSSRMDEDA